MSGIYSINNKTMIDYKDNKEGRKQMEEFTLSEYLDYAKRCISAFAPSDEVQNMLRDEDAISYVAEHLMYAKQRWKKDGGRTVKSYLNQSAIWCIPRWFIIRNRNRNLSLDFILEEHNPSKRNSDYHQLVEDKNQLPPDEYLMKKEEKEKFNKLIERSQLGESQKKYFYEVYDNGTSISDAAKTFGVTRQAVSFSLKLAIDKIKTQYEKETKV